MRNIFKIKKLSVVLTLCLLMSFASANNLFAIEGNTNLNSKDIEEWKVITVYADLSNRAEVVSSAQEVFDVHGNKVVVEVRDNNELTTASPIRNGALSTRAVPDGFWKSNYASYFIGHITYATDGRIKGWVQGSRVLGLRGTVSIYGKGIKFVSKTFHKATSLSAYMRWTIKVGTTTLSYKVSLY
ncbi:MAG: hypothetical protein ACK5KR_00340 [Breznakia sp.]